MRNCKKTRKFDRDCKRLNSKHSNLCKILEKEIRNIARLGPDPRHDRLPGVNKKPVYKCRIPLNRKGKRGGARLIYYCDERSLVLLFIYAKNAKDGVPVMAINDALSQAGLL